MPVPHLFRRLLAHWRLRQAGYCTRHLIKKKHLSERLFGQPIRVFVGEPDLCGWADRESRHAIDESDRYRTYCELCEEEKQKHDAVKLEKSLAELGGKIK